MLLLVPVVNDGGEFTKTANIYCFGMLVTEVIEVIGSTPPFVVMRTFAFAIAKFKCLWNILNDSLVGIVR
ncbi:unnamed protein product [Rhizophagus irregularis]|uniref:Uncharacterized protein n=1 Tax=Rhizophagus irregularis TaxID=588596 RepID=A0A915ZVG2_9GLOM|nr:unnamed protein product [Rhizophagus irregularis]CAB5388748.1 unnamed protein product [Rhizophagus irregularis]